MMKALCMLFSLAGLVFGQTPTSQTMKACWTNTKATRWCVPVDGTSTGGTGIAQGWCCDDASTDEKCTHGGNYQCTLNNKG